MSSRLYPATKWLFSQVVRQLQVLRLHHLLTPLNFGLLALYVCGVILLERRQTATEITRWLPGRAHDALNRLLRTATLSTRCLFEYIVAWARTLGMGYLCIDDVVVSKPHSRRNRWVGWTWSTSEKRKVRGFHVVLLLWCVAGWRIPVSFRIWRPAASCQSQRYRKKTELAADMLREVAALNLPVSYVTGDTLYSGHRLCKLVQRLGWDWVGVLHPRTGLVFKQKRYSAASLATTVRLKWRAKLGVRAVSLTAYSSKYGHLRLVVTQNRHGNYEVLASSNLQADLTSIVLCKRSRWSIETVFRDTKQYVALGACQCRVDQALVRHVAFVLIAFIVLQMLGLHRQETVGETKMRLRLAVMTQGQQPPTPLKGRVSSSELLTA